MINPFVQSNPIVEGMERHRARIEQTRENSTRLAQAYATFDSSGTGEYRAPQVIEFGCTFLDRPVVTYGFSLDGDELVANRFPRCTGGVYRWVRDKDGRYVGAYALVVVDGGDTSITVAQDPPYNLTHDFVFTGIAMKNLPTHLLETDFDGGTTTYVPPT